MRAFLPPLTLLAGAWLAQHLLGRAMMRRRNRINADMPDATEDERVSAAVAEGHTGKLVLGGLATLAGMTTGAIWLLVLMVRTAL